MDSFDPAAVIVRSGHFIGGNYVDEGARRIEVARPSDGAVYASVPLADADMIDRAVENAWQAFRASGWRTTRSCPHHAPFRRSDRRRCRHARSTRSARFNPPNP
jgi:Aldehyde dehydrogenase family